MLKDVKGPKNVSLFYLLTLTDYSVITKRCNMDEFATFWIHTPDKKGVTRNQSNW